jgi:sensor domain CHASE-containing protein
VYLINGWLYRSAKVIWIFTGIFVIGYLLIWLAIYLIGRRNAQKLNQGLRKKQQTRNKDE